MGILADYLLAVEALGRYKFGNAHQSAVRLCLMLFGELKLRLELGLETEGLMLEREEYIHGCADMFLRAYRVG